jgi:hypothetical protein
VALPVAACCTAIENAGNEVVTTPSLTRIVMLE